MFESNNIFFKLKCCSQIVTLTQNRINVTGGKLGFFVFNMIYMKSFFLEWKCKTCLWISECNCRTRKCNYFEKSYCNSIYENICEFSFGQIENTCLMTSNFVPIVKVYDLSRRQNLLDWTLTFVFLNVVFSWKIFFFSTVPNNILISSFYRTIINLLVDWNIFYFKISKILSKLYSFCENSI